ncbi:Phytanoyl-coa dioxygenase, partial [Globisporangium splendens]
MTLDALVREFHDVGFVAIPKQKPDDAASSNAIRTPPQALVESVHALVTRKYEALLQHAQQRGIDLTKPENAEVIPGFYVRQGGRIDMQISALAFQKRAKYARTKEKEEEDVDVAIDMQPFADMAACWQPLVTEIFKDDASPATGSNAGTNAVDGSAAVPAKMYRLEYVGCVVSRPGDADQNWHLDGVHRNLKQHEPADRLNVFVPLADLRDERLGGTEMKARSHFLAKTDNGSSFEAYEHLESVTHFVEAGTPLVMDYRVWHRGLANTSEATLRPLLYFKYVKLHAPSSVANGGTKKRAVSADAKTAKPRKRVALIQVESK